MINQHSVHSKAKHNVFLWSLVDAWLCSACHSQPKLRDSTGWIVRGGGCGPAGQGKLSAARRLLTKTSEGIAAACLAIDQECRWALIEWRETGLSSFCSWGLGLGELDFLSGECRCGDWHTQANFWMLWSSSRQLF